VDVSGVQITSGSSGVAVIVVALGGQNSIVVVPGANAALTPLDLEKNIGVIRSAGVVLTQLETPLETVLHLATLCAREGVPLILDPAPAKELPPELLEKVEWFTPNETEAAFYLGATGSTAEASQTAQHLLDKGLSRVLLKLGPRGAYLARKGFPGRSVSPFPVEAVDTTAAGDCFNGAFATGLLLGKDPVQSARFAAAAAAVSVTRSGAQPSMPSRKEVEALLATYGTIN
jgi:ribokinase